MTTAPGVNVTTSAARPVGSVAPDAATVFLRRTSGYGTLAPTAITAADVDGRTFSIGARALLVLGAPPADVVAGTETLRVLFAEGAQRVYHQRITGPDAAAASLTFTDGADPVITLHARYVGSYGNHLKAHLEDGTTTGVKLTITDPDSLGILDSPIVLDDLADATAIAAAIAADPILSGELTTVIADGAAAGVPTTPAIDTPLDGGDDDLGTTPTPAPFPPELGPGVMVGAVSINPLVGADPMAATLIALAEEAAAARRIALVGFEDTRPADFASVATYMDDLYDAVVEATDADRAEELLGYLIVPGVDVITPSRIGNVPVPAAYYIAGARARTIAAYGPHRAPAGEVSVARYIKGPTLDDVTVDAVDDPTASDIFAAHLNAIRIIAGTTRNYGWQTLARGPEWNGATNRDTLNVIAAEADTRAETIAFRPIDGKGAIFADLNAILIGVAEDYKAIGAIYPRLAADGTELDPGYAVDTGSTVNTIDTIAAGEVNGRLGVRISPTGAIVNIDVAKVAVGGTF